MGGGFTPQNVISSSAIILIVGAGCLEYYWIGSRFEWVGRVAFLEMVRASNDWPLIPLLKLFHWRQYR